MNIIIIGAGALGVRLAEILLDEDHNITIIEKDESKVDKLVETYDIQGVAGLATHCDVLREAGVKESDLVIATTPSDENNILACLIAKKMGVSNTIARVRNPEYATQMNFMREELGVSLMVNPDLSAALEIYRTLQFPSTINVESFSNGRIDIAGIKITDESPLCNRKLFEFSDKFSGNFIICAVSRGHEVYIPNGDFTILPGDTVHVTGSHKSLGKIAKELSGKKAKMLKKIMIIGGSRISIYLSNMLASIGKDVIVIEPNKDRCDKLFEFCPKATVINGDYNDYSLLLKEGIESMDAVVTLSDYDETNFLVSMFSESVNVKKNITKVNSQNLVKMLNTMDMDSYVNVPEITCDAICQYVRAKKSVSSASMKTLYKLVDGKIEASEFVAGDDTKFLGKQLNTIKMKNNVLIAAVTKKNKIIFPSGNDVIESGDRVVIVSKGSIIYSLNDILA